jgi:methylthioribose-1-phosphate isomerase
MSQIDYHFTDHSIQDHEFKSFTPMTLTKEAVHLIDQRVLPTQEKYVYLYRWDMVAHAIRDMLVRGAPAIGITAAYGLVQATRNYIADHPQGNLLGCIKFLEEAALGLSQTRPTAVNLFWAIERMAGLWRDVDLSQLSCDQLLTQLIHRARQIHQEDVSMCRAMGHHGAQLLQTDARVMTYCNTGALATGGHGTALGVIRSAWEQGKLSQVYTCETRPFLQGSRLSAWELHKDQIPLTLICDNMSAYFMAQNKVDAVFVGADRIASNGDVANKIGTYALSLVARAHQVPFYVVAPSSTIDLACSGGDKIIIEQRNVKEVSYCGTARIAPLNINIENPAFDVTPADLITAIITEHAVIPRGNYPTQLAQHVQVAMNSQSTYT